MSVLQRAPTEPTPDPGARPDTGDQLQTLRQRLRDARAALYERFDCGDTIADLVHARSATIDETLGIAWDHHVPAGAPAALVAVGGYGRGELHPASDVDILVLLGSGAMPALQEPIERFIAFLFDLGLDIGHSVRNLEQCVSAAGDDVTVMTSLMEARLLTGPAGLLEGLRTATAPDRIWPSGAFFSAKVREQRARWAKFGDSAYNLEPNIKENPGGLRDIQMIGWVAKRHFAAETLHELVDHGFIAENEYATLIDGQVLLWRIRFALHRLTGRHEDRLLFDYQRTLATQFGFCDGENNLAVEQFMQQYYRTVVDLNRLNEMLLQLFHEAILLGDALGPPTPINRRFQSRSGYIEVTADDVFRRSPLALLEIFLLLETHANLLGVRASTIRLIREHRHRIDEDFRQSLPARSLFMEILRQPVGVTHALRRMNQYGVLAAYIPAFANIVGRMQYDLFHVYTVDEHTLMLLRNLRRFTVPQFAGELPLCTAIAQRIPKLELLYLAGLFHDIAKGRGGDHSVLGMRDAWDFCQLHGLSEFDSRLVAWLVEQHLTLSMTAQRKDISDPEVVQTFAGQVGDINRLDYLYLLTVADARATNPAGWNAWIAALLRDLYHATRRALLRGLDSPQTQDELIGLKQQEALRLMSRYGEDRQACIDAWLKFSLDFFLHSSPDEIAWQTRQVLAATPEHLPLVEVRPVTARGGTEIFIYTHDHDGLFRIVTALLDQMALNIMDARIMTTDDGMALNAFQVLEPSGKPVDARGPRPEEIRKTLALALRERPWAGPQVLRRLPRRHLHFPVETRVSFATEERNHRTMMRLTTRDRPGLLADVGAVFNACSIRVQNAKIATIGAQVEDVFFITTRQDTPITCEAALACLRRELHARLEDVAA
jgi:[protein-PII] uridylyltransferase